MRRGSEWWVGEVDGMSRELGGAGVNNRVLKKEVPINRVSWQRSLRPWSKIEYSSLNFHPFSAAFSGIALISCFL
jgi:hypothetical protein